MKKLLTAVLLFLLLSCNDRNSNILGNIEPPVLARFNFEISEDSIVSFNNLSVNANSFIWDFGDGTQSFDADPVHAFENGFYTVKLEAIGGTVVSSYVKSIDIVTELPEFIPPPVDTFRIIQSKWEFLTGGEGNSKAWQLANIENVLQFGPKEDLDTRWWGMGPNDIAARTCLMNNEFSFSYDSIYTRNVNGAVWKEFNMFASEGCMTTSAFETTNKGTTSTSWGDGSFDFRMRLAGDSTLLEAHGLGSYIGHYVFGIDDSSWESANTYSYLITDITADTLKIQAYGFAGDSPITGYSENEADRYWKAVLVAQ